jgi:hypothetical protein
MVTCLHSCISSSTNIVLLALQEEYPVPAALTTEEVGLVVKDFALAAKRSVKVGLQPTLLDGTSSLQLLCVGVQ